MRVREILDLIPDCILNQIGKDVEVDKANQKLTGKNIFKVLLFSLSETTRISLRIIETVYNSTIFKQFIGDNENYETRHSSLADRLGKINPKYFESVFNFLVANYKDKVPLVTQSKLYKFDATLIGLSSKLFVNGFEFGSENRKYLKVVVGLKDVIPSSIYFCSNQSESNDNIALANAIAGSSVKSNDIITFDRGLYKTDKLIDFTSSDITFVTRMRINRRFKVIKDFKLDSSCPENIISDQKILLRRKKSFHKIPFRIITVESNNGDNVLLLSNSFALSAEEISNIYKRRWDIEVFFKFIKQELNMKHFLSRNLNGLKVHIYMILIFSILLLIYKSTNKLSGFKLVKIRFFQELEVEIISDIIGICGGDPNIFINKYQSNPQEQFF